MAKTKSQKQRARAARRTRTTNNTTRVNRPADGILGMPTSWPGSSSTTPGRAHARMVTEVFSSDDSRAFSKAGFSTWSSQLDGLLSPYKFFRVCQADVEVVVIGGAASPYSVAFNVSNAPDHDTGIAAVLNDDYSAVSTAMLRPKIRTPMAFWNGRPHEWYYYVNSGAATAFEMVAGGISLTGSGGATSGTVVGYLVIDLVVEFHTLV